MKKDGQNPEEKWPPVKGPSEPSEDNSGDKYLDKMSSETDLSLNFSDWFKMLPKALKWAFWNFNQEVLYCL